MFKHNETDDYKHPLHTPILMSSRRSLIRLTKLPLFATKKISISMIFLAILILLTSLAIAACGAYFSILGLSLLFVGSGISIIVMGTALEVGKLVAVSFLHQYWDSLGKLLKVYLIAAAVILSVITSIGIYGYLANGYNATAIKLTEFEQTTIANKKSIDALNKENERLIKLNNEPTNLPENTALNVNKDIDLINVNKDKTVAQVLQLIQQKEARINDIKATIASDKKKASDDIALAKANLDTNIAKESEQIKLFNDRLSILDKEVQTWLDQGTGNIFTANGLQKARETRQLQEKERAQIDTQIKDKQNNIEKLRTEYNTQVANINKTLEDLVKSADSKITGIEAEITKDKQGTDAIQQEANKRINELLALKETKSKEVEKTITNVKAAKEKAIIDNNNLIKLNETQIDALQKQNNELQMKALHTDVGTFKFVAKSIGFELDQTVNWFIWLIMLVFDPLAVSLLLCFNTIVEKIKKNKPTSLTTTTLEPVTTITSTSTTPEPIKVIEKQIEPIVQPDEIEILKQFLHERKEREKEIAERKAKGKPTSF